MSKSKFSRNIWRPLNRKSQILATIAALAFAGFQIYFWYGRLVHQQPPSLTSDTSHSLGKQSR